VAKVSPVFKTGDRKDRSNYRPISVLPVVSKIFEKLILIILQKVPHKSVMYWYKHMDKGDIDIAVFIDLKKAFDTVDHNILLNKLMRYGIKDND
jgi:sarcosine oxidase/L-pipecolate oxidase